ncbi:psychosine receptor [Cuculus canorus]|nr:psychosine receptor [Cuculus canorus]
MESYQPDPEELTGDHPSDFLASRLELAQIYYLGWIMNTTYKCHDDHTLDKYLFPFVYSIVMMISIPINCISLCVSCIQVRKKNELAVYLFSLSLADILYSLILPLWIEYAWNGDNWMHSALLCQISAFLMYMNFYTSTAFLACISVDRYLALVHPLKLQHLRTRRFSLIVSISVWLLESIFNSVILVKKEVFNDPCNFTNHTLCYDKYPLEWWQARINLFRICSGYLVPLIIIVFCYHKIYQVVRCNQATVDEEKKKVRKLILNITVTFIVCFTPYHIVLLIRSIKEPYTADPQLLLYKVYRITQALTSLNCIADPILYCFVSETARTDILNLLRCCFCLQKHERDQAKDHALCSSATKSSALITYRTSCEMETVKKA